MVEHRRRPPRSSLLALSTLVLAACDPAVASDSDRGATVRNATVDDFAATPKPRRGRMLSAETIARRIEWPDAAPVRSSSIDRLDTVALERAPVPVLVPDEFEDGATVTAGESWFSFGGVVDGVELTVHGSARGRLVPGIRAVSPTHTIRDNPGFVTRNEGIWSVSWTEHGAAYSLEVGCSQADDVRCDEESFALAWVDRLVLAGGQEVSR